MRRVVGNFVWLVIAVSMVKILGAYWGLLAPLVVASVIVLAVAALGVVRRQEIRSNRRVATFVAACAAPSVVVVAVFVGYFVYRSRL